MDWFLSLNPYYYSLDSDLLKNIRFRVREVTRISRKGPVVSHYNLIQQWTISTLT